MSVKVSKKGFMIYLLFVSNLQNCLFICLSFCLFCLFGLRNDHFLSAYEFAYIYTCLNSSVDLRKKEKSCHSVLPSLYSNFRFCFCWICSVLLFVRFVFIVCSLFNPDNEQIHYFLESWPDCYIRFGYRLFEYSSLLQ